MEVDEREETTVISREKQGIDGETRLAGVIGNPIAHTLSPAMQNAAFAHYGLNVAYVPFGIPEGGLQGLLKTLQGLRACGVNVTVPYKQKVMPFLDECARSAKTIGAVNTIVFKKDKLIGHNTDGYGFLASVQEKINLRSKRVVLLGGGGGGRAVAISLAGAGVKKLTIVDIDRNCIKALVRDVKAVRAVDCQGLMPGVEALRLETQQADLVVNATPLGLKAKDPLPLAEHWLPKRKCVMDLAYGKKPTPFLRAAKKRGNVLVPGWTMLLHQGAEAFRLWTGKKPPIKKMQTALMQAGGLKAI